MVAKAEVNLNWLWTIEWLWIVWLYIYIHERFILANTNVLTVFMIYLLQHLVQEYEEHDTYWEHQYRMGEGSFFYLKKSNIF